MFHPSIGPMADTFLPCRGNSFSNIPSVIMLSGGARLCQMAPTSNWGETTASDHTNSRGLAKLCQAAVAFKVHKEALRCRAVL